MGKPTFMYNVVIVQTKTEKSNLLNEEGNICIKMDKGDMNGVFKRLSIC